MVCETIKLTNIHAEGWTHYLVLMMILGAKNMRNQISSFKTLNSRQAIKVLFELKTTETLISNLA